MPAYEHAIFQGHPPWGRRLSVEDEARYAPAPRQEVAFTCAKGHTFPLVFAGDAEVPGAWDCPRCGGTARRDGAPEDAEPSFPRYQQIGVARGSRAAEVTPMAQLLKRRGPAELEVILAESLGALRQQRGGTA